jgi:GxxExxY protein
LRKNSRNTEEKYPLQQETKTIIGICMEVHRYFGHGFLEIIYKDAIEKELKWKGIAYEREKKHEVFYKGELLSHFFFCRFCCLWKHYS